MSNGTDGGDGGTRVTGPDNARGNGGEGGDGGGEPNGNGARHPDPKTVPEAFVRLLHPITLTVMVILFGVTALIAAAVLGFDSGRVLPNMASHDFARGLITYLFAVTTICTSVVLVLAALMKEIDEKAFGRGKEVLGLLLGVFGTIVGFYFGSEAGQAERPAMLRVTEAIVVEEEVSSGDTITVITAARGGTPPYRFAAGTGSAADLEYSESLDADGLISVVVIAPDVEEAEDVDIVVGVMDARDNVVTREVTVRVSPPAGGG